MALFDTIRAGASGAADDYEVERSLRFNDDDSPGLSRTPSSTGNQRTFTVSAWVKRQNLILDTTIFLLVRVEVISSLYIFQVSQFFSYRNRWWNHSYLREK